MKITPQQYAISLYQALSECRPQDQERVLDNFVRLLAEAGQLSRVAEIEAEFIKYDLKQKGQVSATAKFALPGAESARVLDTLNSVLGRNVVFKKEVDENLVGGVLVETEDERIDLSVKKQLEDLKKALSE
jgi:F-type H+-transporting ATPase subunit delta